MYQVVEKNGTTTRAWSVCADEAEARECYERAMNFVKRSHSVSLIENDVVVDSYPQPEAPEAPECILIRDVQRTAQAIEQKLHLLYYEELTYEQRKVALQYVFLQTRKFKDLTDSLFTQYRRLESM